MKRYRGLTDRQTEVLGLVATGQCPSASSKTLEALLRKGLIVRLKDRVVGHDVLGAIKVPQYEMPLAEHIEWCAWASQQDAATAEGRS